MNATASQPPAPAPETDPDEPPCPLILVQVRFPEMICRVQGTEAGHCVIAGFIAQALSFALAHAGNPPRSAFGFGPLSDAKIMIRLPDVRAGLRTVTETLEPLLLTRYSAVSWFDLREGVLRVAHTGRQFLANALWNLDELGSAINQSDSAVRGELLASERTMALWEKLRLALPPLPPPATDEPGQ